MASPAELRREIETESTLGLNQVYKPSALKLFPTIGMLTNEETNLKRLFVSCPLPSLTPLFSCPVTV